MAPREVTSEFTSANGVIGDIFSRNNVTFDAVHEPI